MYDQMGDRILALKYFQQGLEIRNQSKAPDLSRVASLTNVASGYSAVGTMDEALKALDEAEEILSKQRFPQIYYIAYLDDTRGKLYFKQGKIDKADELFMKAVRGREEVSYGKNTHVESLINVMKVAVKKGDNYRCIKTGKTVLSFIDDVIKQSPKSHLLTACYYCLASVYKAMGDDANVRDQGRSVEARIPVYMRLQ
ncbi:hypothetical protein DPMN_046480 [Dreissena polymorpha]|uniref:Tetratricopeptide repeat protein n=1 Tax=Dreissena polymorpha TaxID=45954 RepID=A0A9D4D7V1_DREPO|nr:hypothetical protein DPMN_046480 [Dreissena polymorpha]